MSANSAPTTESAVHNRKKWSVATDRFGYWVQAQNRQEIKTLRQGRQHKDKAMTEVATLLLVTEKERGLLLKGPVRLTGTAQKQKAVWLIRQGSSRWSGSGQRLRRIRHLPAHPQVLAEEASPPPRHIEPALTRSFCSVLF